MTKRLYKSKDAIVAGVAGGVAEYFSIDKTVVRIIWLISILFFGVGFLPYIVCAIIIPNNPDKDSYEYEKDSHEVSDERRRLFAIALVSIGFLLLFKRFMPFNFILSWRVAFPLLLVGCGVYLLKKGGDNDE